MKIPIKKFESLKLQKLITGKWIIYFFTKNTLFSVTIGIPCKVVKRHKKATAIAVFVKK